MEIVSLPPNVVEQLAPLAEAIRQGATEAGMLQLRERVSRRWDYGRYLESPSYGRGAARAAAMIGTTLAELTSVRAMAQWDQEVSGGIPDDESESESESDEDDEDECSHGDQRTCCGYCYDCDSHTDDYDSDVEERQCPRGHRYDYCRECEHYCSE